MSTSHAAASSAGHVFQVFRSGEQLTRARIIELTGLSRSTVQVRLDELIDLGLVRAVGDADSSGGRPAQLFAWQPEARLVGGADFGASHATVILTDLAGRIVARQNETRSIASGPDESIGWLASTIRSLLAQLGRPERDLLGVGIGLPGPVEWLTGRPAHPPIMPEWHGVDVPALVRDILGVPATVDNDVNLMALGEHAVAWPTVADLIFVKVATGIGSGIISGGALRRGVDGIAGDIGHVRIARGAGVHCTCGDEGCLEAMASGPAIAAALRLEGVQARDGAAAVALARANDPRALAAMRQAGRDIGDVLAAAVRFLNPRVIVLGGSIARVGEPLLEGVREVLSARSSSFPEHPVLVVPSTTGTDAATLGASRLALTAALDSDSVELFSRART